MLGRKTFSPDELAHGRAAVKQQVAAFDELGDVPADVETTWFGGLALALDRRYVHRVRMVTGKEGTPLNELELVVEALIDHDGVLTPGPVIRYDAASSVLGVAPGDRVALTRDGFVSLAEACFSELDEKFRE
jgi:hypothetical protein